MKKVIVIVVVVLAVLGLGVFLSNRDSKPVVSNNFSSVPDANALKANMQKAGLDQLSAEGTVMHIHQHLDIVINGQNMVVPAEIGIGPTFISPIHTHDNTGVIHVESPIAKDFKLGQFFDEWGVVLSDRCVGNYCADSGHKLIVAVNGSPITNAHDYVLKAHDEIEMWYGPSNQNPTLIKSYDFGPSL